MSPMNVLLSLYQTFPIVEVDFFLPESQSENVQTPVKSRQMIRDVDDIRCPECERPFYSAETMRSHLKICHYNVKSCKLCGEGVDNAEELIIHLKEMHRENPDE